MRYDWRGPRYEAPHTVFESDAGPSALDVSLRLPPGATALTVEDRRPRQGLAFLQTPAPGAEPENINASPPTHQVSFTLPLLGRGNRPAVSAVSDARMTCSEPRYSEPPAKGAAALPVTRAVG